MAGADLRARLRAYVAEHGLIAPGARVVVAVSGGMDSVALLRLLSDDFRPVAVHVHHGLRDEADADARFVETLGERWGVPVEVRAGPVGEGENVQAAARAARYAALGEATCEHRAAVIATGHHRDDLAETLLLNLLRGAGPAGLAGIPPRRPLAPGSPVEVVRPLLFAHRAELRAFAEAEGLDWREDASNASTHYRRNALRHEVLPLLEEKFGPDVSGRLADTTERLRGLVDAGAALAPAKTFEGAVGEDRSLRLDALRAMAEPVRLGVFLEALARWAPGAPRSAAPARALDALLDAQPGRWIELGGATVWREREGLRFAPPAPPAYFEAPVVVGRPVETPWGVLRTEPTSAIPDGFDPSPLVEVADANRLVGPLVLRTWRAGDALVPLGMVGTKKVSDLLTERHVPPSARARQLVLTAGGEVVWVVGHRLAEAARVRPATRRALRLAWEPSRITDPGAPP